MISVLIPAYNRPQMLTRAVQSVLSQTFKDFELIVIDDGSTENLSEVQKIVENAGHCYLRQAHAGVAAARNRGIQKSSGEWFALLDSDDHWLPEKLQIQNLFHMKNPDILLSQCEERWHRHGKRVNKKDYHAMASGNAFAPSLTRCCISASSIMLHRSVIEDCGVFDESLSVCEDYDLWIRVTKKYQIGLIDQELVWKFGGHSDQLSQSQPAMDRFRVYALLKLFVDPDLTLKERELVSNELRLKSEVLLKGARKHNIEAVPVYERLLRMTSQADIPDGRELLSIVQGVLLKSEQQRASQVL